MNTVKTSIRKNIKGVRRVPGLSQMPDFKNIVFGNESISFQLSDHRMITIPIQWVPKLEMATSEVRENYIIRGHFVFWEAIDEIIGVKNLLNGTIVPL